MKPLTSNVFVETQLRGSNHGIVTTSDGIVLIDGPHKPSDALRLKAEIERRGRLRYILDTEPHGDHRYPMDVEQDGMAPMVMRLNVANLYDYVTGAGIHARA